MTFHPWFSLRRRLADYESPPYHRPFNEDVERRLRRLSTSRTWADYLDMVDAQVNLLAERMLQAPPDEVPYIVAEIRGVRSVPEKLTQILRGIEHERNRAAEAERDRAERERSWRDLAFASPFWRSPESD